MTQLNNSFLYKEFIKFFEEKMGARFVDAETGETVTVIDGKVTRVKEDKK